MHITLHTATESVRELLDQIDPETGEMPEGFEKARELVAQKAVATTAYLIEQDRHIESVKAYIKELAAKVKTAEKRQDWLRSYLQSHMTAAGITEIKDERGLFKATLQVGRDESVEIYSEALLPPNCYREIPVSYEPDKTLIKRCIKDGMEIPGARLVKKDRLTIK